MTESSRTLAATAGAAPPGGALLDGAGLLGLAIAALVNFELLPLPPTACAAGETTLLEDTAGAAPPAALLVLTIAALVSVALLTGDAMVVIVVPWIAPAAAGAAPLKNDPTPQRH